MGAKWTDGLEESVYTRLADCRSEKEDILPLTRAMWSHIKGSGKYDKEDALTKVLELLDSNNCVFELTKVEYCDILNAIPDDEIEEGNYFAIYKCAVCGEVVVSKDFTIHLRKGGKLDLAVFDGKMKCGTQWAREDGKVFGTGLRNIPTPIVHYCGGLSGTIGIANFIGFKKEG